MGQYTLALTTPKGDTINHSFEAPDPEKAKEEALKLIARERDERQKLSPRIPQLPADAELSQKICEWKEWTVQGTIHLAAKVMENMVAT
jgi:hypothetical protein